MNNVGRINIRGIEEVWEGQELKSSDGDGDGMEVRWG
jgi:hypothetical protein